MRFLTRKALVHLSSYLALASDYRKVLITKTAFQIFSQAMITFKIKSWNHNIYCKDTLMNSEVIVCDQLPVCLPPFKKTKTMGILFLLCKLVLSSPCLFSRLFLGRNKKSILKKKNYHQDFN